MASAQRIFKVVSHHQKKKKKRPRKGLSIQKPPKAKTINKKAEKTNECGRTQPPEAE